MDSAGRAQDGNPLGGGADDPPGKAEGDGGTILAGAISYALKAVSLVTPGDLARPTPCRAWDLGLLLGHLCDSIAALDEAIVTGHLALEPPSDPVGPDTPARNMPMAPTACPDPYPSAPSAPETVTRRHHRHVAEDDREPAELVKDRAADLLCTVFTAPERVIDVAGLPVPGALVVATGAMEISVHGWDVYVACGHDRPIPAELAGPLIRLSPLLITDREGLFACPVAVPPDASPGDRLVAYLGRDPGRVTRLPLLVTHE
jgi:uncharacterized protein (TIGR03086 family)